MFCDTGNEHEIQDEWSKLDFPTDGECSVSVDSFNIIAGTMEFRKVPTCYCSSVIWPQLGAGKDRANRHLFRQF